MGRQIFALQDRDIIPMVGQESIARIKEAGKALLIKWHFTPGEAQQLFKLMHLLSQQLILRKVLALHQEIEDLVLEILRHG